MPTYMGEDEVIEKNMALEQERIYTIEDIETLPEDARMELIDGRIYYMATPSSDHQKMLTFLLRKIGNYIEENDGDCEVYPAPLALYLNKDNLTYLEPDIMVVCDPEKMDPKGCHGAPDFVAEIVSPSSRSRDYLLKLNKYQAAGVKEYWIVDLERKIVTVYMFGKGTVYNYDIHDRIPVDIMNGLMIDFSELKF